MESQTMNGSPKRWREMTPVQQLAHLGGWQSLLGAAVMAGCLVGLLMRYMPGLPWYVCLVGVGLAVCGAGIAVSRRDAAMTFVAGAGLLACIVMLLVELGG
jgi:hypothetical protein